ncbi:MAG: SAM-dependent methyltransferase [Betaproteobacteria bacterium]|nr:MAG: SAM-dependent methyltransferase [Betaproteobacteria bacterium]
MKQSLHQQLNLRPEQSIELLKALHIVTRDGAINQDSRRKLKQVNHLLQFIEPLLASTVAERGGVTLVDHGAGKSYLGFMLYDLFFQSRKNDAKTGHIYGIETRAELVDKSVELAKQLGFADMSFLNVSAADAITSPKLPAAIDVVTALHACDTATDDAIAFALAKRAKYVVLVPCCQAELAACFRKEKSNVAAKTSLGELWKHPIQAREFGSQLTNVLRGLWLEANGYHVTVTELVGWEHSMKNELIIAQFKHGPGNPARVKSRERLSELIATFGLSGLGRWAI